jgi:hypothetical protein
MAAVALREIHYPKERLSRRSHGIPKAMSGR